MERSEPALVPEWLKNGGSLNGGGSVSHSDDAASAKLVRNKTCMHSSGHDFGQSTSSARSTSSYFRRSSSSNGSGHLRSYSSFGRNQYDRDWEKDTYDSRDRDKRILGERRHLNISEPQRNTLSSNFERHMFSLSINTGKLEDTWPTKIVTEFSNARGKSNNGVLSKGSPAAGLKKSSFERDFPTLGAEERAVIPEVGRVASPGLSSAIQSLPTATSAKIGGEKWTSALAEVPIVVGSNGTGIRSSPPATPSGSAPMGVSKTSSLNMAEAVAQGPSHAQTAPQLSLETQRLEELAIKQSRQLIPVRPSTPKNLVLSSSDKQKPKVAQQQLLASSPLAANHSPRGGPVKVDALKAGSNVGKLHVLKPVREKNGVTSAAKDFSTPTSSGKLVNSAATHFSGSAATRGPPNNPVPDRKLLSTVLEKRPTIQAQSRNDFFKLVRERSMVNSCSVTDSATTNSSSGADSALTNSLSVMDTDSTISPFSPDKPEKDASSTVSLNDDSLPEARDDFTCTGDVCDVDKHVSNGKKDSHADADPDPTSPNEEEAAFLRSMGWEENSDEGGLTEEEINAFLMDVKSINSMLPLKILQGVPSRLLLSLDSQIGSFSSGLSSSDSKLES